MGQTSRSAAAAQVAGELDTGPAEDLHLAGRQVILATGPAPRCARFYRGKDVVAWLAEMGYYTMPVDQHPLREGVRDNTNHYVTGRDGGRDIDLRRFAGEGMQLFGRLTGFDAGLLRFEPTLRDIGLPWLHTWGSGRFSGVAADAEFVVAQIHERQRARSAARATVGA